MTTATPARAPAAPAAPTGGPGGAARVLTLLVTLALVGAAAIGVGHRPGRDAAGQVALEVVVGGRPVGSGAQDGGPPAPIASLAKVMTAYVVLTRHPLRAGRAGYTITVTAGDVRDTAGRRAGGQSTVPVRAGEELTQRQALQALLLPSANNVAAMLAVAEAGSQEQFVARMNRQARALGMRDTRYTDPSGFQPSTVSTAADQLILADAAMAIPEFARIVRQREAVIPVAGRIANTDRLLGRDGFVGIKTGSMAAAGGCFMFRSVQRVRGVRVVVTGVVLGRAGPDLVTAGQEAARHLVRHEIAELTPG